MLQKSSIYQTIKIFFVNPAREYSLAEISREAGLAHTSVKKNLDKLVKSGMIKKTIKTLGKRKFPVYTANSEDKEFKQQRIIHNIESVIESGIVNFIEEKLAPKTIILFGSYRRGEDQEESDIDLFVECREEKLDLSKFEKELKRGIQLHFKENFSSYPKELKNNIINGIILSGFLEGYK